MFHARKKTRLQQCCTLSAFVLLAACGGGSSSGGSGPISAPPPLASAPAPAPIATPAPSPAPTPAPSPTPSPTPAPSPATLQTAPVPAAFDTAEFRRSNGPSQHNAVTAWQNGQTGKGVTIAIVDSGIDGSGPEFVGRLSPASRDIYADRQSLAGPDDHGTRVALVAAGARDGRGVLGMAYEATILALRADRPGTCAGDGNAGAASECSFVESAIADAVTYAASNGARVINISLGGGSASHSLANAVRDAVAHGVLVVVAAGNDGQAGPTDFTRGLTGAGSGGVIVVGSVDETNQLSDFSNRAGSDAGAYLAARGQRVCCVYEDGNIYVSDKGYGQAFSGTSFAAPQVAGAAALLAQAFPHLTGKQLASILLESAFDAGAAGADAVYGRGILDLLRAFQPLGQTSIAGQNTAVALADGMGAGSPAMGDALASISLPTLVTDGFDRAFAVDLGAGLRGAQLPGRLRPAVESRQRQVAMSSEAVSLAFSIDASGRSEAGPTAGALHLSREEAEQARVLAAQVAFALSPATHFGFAYAQGSDGLAAQMRGHARPAFMIAGDASGDDGAFDAPRMAVALRHRLGDLGLTISGESGETLSGATVSRAATLRGERLRGEVQTIGLAADRDFGGLEAVLGLAWRGERYSLLGARFHDALGLEGADTFFLDGEAGWRLAPRWRVGAAFRQGFTKARDGGLVAPGSRLASNSWSLDIAHSGVFAPHDSLAFRVSQPLRVAQGALNLNLPQSWDYSTLTAGYGVQSLSLAPEGREIMGELAWSGSLLSGHAAASLFYRRDPGHYAAIPDDAGVALRWSRGF